MRLVAPLACPPTPSSFARRSAASFARRTVALTLALGLASGCTSEDEDEPVGSAGVGGLAGGAGQGGSDAGGAAGDAGSGGAGGTGPLSALCPEGAAFCEDFESHATGQPPAAPWQPSLNGATAVVDATRAFSGANALYVNAPTGSNYRRGYVALQQSSFPGAEQEMFGRLMVWLEAGPQTAGTNGVHWTLFQGEGRSADDTYNAIYRFGGQHQTDSLGLMANYETTPPVASDCWDHSQTTLPVQEWACVEWRFVQATNEMQFWLNGAELGDIHVVDRGEGCINEGAPLNGQWLAPPTFQTLYVGWEHYQPPTNDVNVWIDGLVVSTTRVGCPAAP